MKCYNILRNQESEEKSNVREVLSGGNQFVLGNHVSGIG
jgi:hypothetical protein